MTNNTYEKKKQNTFNRSGPHSSGHFVNDKIRAEQLRVISPDGKNLGLFSRREALALAEEHGLDLVQISESNETVIARIMDFGKFLYEKKKQQGEAKKNQKVIQIKEIKVRPQIETNDYLVKMGKCFEFLKEGKRVKFSLQLRGRENITLVDKVQEIFQRIQQDIDKEFGANIIKEPLQKANSLYSMVVYLK